MKGIIQLMQGSYSALFQRLWECYPISMAKSRDYVPYANSPMTVKNAIRIGFSMKVFYFGSLKEDHSFYKGQMNIYISLL